MSRARKTAKAPAQLRKTKMPAKAAGSKNRLGVEALFGVALAVATIAVYSPVLGLGFVKWDDQHYVTGNSHVRNGLNWNTVRWAFTSTEASNWHPLTWLSHALDYQLFALNAGGHHLDSMALHAVNAVLLFAVLAWVTKRAGPSLFVAALFALHPINVESVAWVAERKNVLSTLFFFLAIAAYGRYARKPGWGGYVLVGGMFAAGLMAKPMVITLPFVLLLLDYWPLERMGGKASESTATTGDRLPQVSFWELVLEKIPLLALSTGSAWITLIAQRPAKRTLAELSFGVRIENAIVSYGLYLWKMVWPAHLSFYPHAVGLPTWQWVLSALILMTITAFVIVFRSERYLVTGWCWFLGTLVPVIGLVQVGEYAMADRYAYIPLIGIFVMIAWSLSDLADGKKIGRVWLTAPALCALAALGYATNRQMSYWESDYDLWSHALEVREDSLTLNALGVTLMHPDSEMTREDVRNFGTEQSRMDDARRDFERALELRQALARRNPGAYLPDIARTLNNLGNLDRLQNRPEDGRQHGEEALDIYRRLAQQNPDVYVPYLAGALNNLGSLDEAQNRKEAARRHFEEAVKIDRQLAERNPNKYLPNLAMTLNEFGFLNAGEGRMDDARQHYQEALKIDRQLAAQSPSVYLPDLAITLTEFARLNAIQNRMEEARQHYEEALRIQRQLAAENPPVYLPAVAMTLENLGRVERLENRIEEAGAHYSEAMSLYRRLAESDPRKYAGEVDKVQASLEELKKKPRAEAK